MRTKMTELLAKDLLRLYKKKVCIEYTDIRKKEVNYFHQFDYDEGIDLFLTQDDMLINYVITDEKIMIVFMAERGNKVFKIHKGE